MIVGFGLTKKKIIAGYKILFEQESHEVHACLTLMLLE
jgi:hypothetical protein